MDALRGPPHRPDRRERPRGRGRARAGRGRAPVANPTCSTQDGMRGFFIRAPFAVIASATLFAHVYVGSETTRTVRVEGHGPGTRGLGPRAPRTTCHVHDPARARPRRPGTRRRLRDPRPTSAGRASDDAGRHLPWGVSTSRTQQIDHTEAFDHRGPPGQSRVSKYRTDDTVPPPHQDPHAAGRCGNPSTIFGGRDGGSDVVARERRRAGAAEPGRGTGQQGLFELVA